MPDQRQILEPLFPSAELSAANHLPEPGMAGAFFNELPNSPLDDASLWPFFSDSDVKTESVVATRQDENTVSFITEDDLKVACEKAYQEGFLAARQDFLSDTEQTDTNLQNHEKGYEQGFAQGIEKGMEQGHAKGLEQGKSEGLLKQQERFDHQQRLFAQLMEQLEGYHSVLDQQLTEGVVELVGSLSRALIQAELTLQPGVIYRVVRQAVELLPRQATHVRVHVNPDDLPELRVWLNKPEADDSLPLELISDDTQEKGGCRIVSDQAEIDAGLSQRMDAYLNSVRSLLAKNQVAEPV